MSVVIETTLGDFTVDLFIEERPQTCKNFLKLCKMKYYNFCLFHSVQHNFIAQTGDPTGTGKSGESVFGKIHGEERKYFAAEIMPKIKHSKAGVLSMVNCGNNMLGSQFFLTLSNDLQSLDSEHCVFGELVEGHEILLKLNEVICDNEHRPYQDIRITHTVILEDPFEDPPGLEVPDQSPEPTKENLVNGRIAPDEELDESKGLTAVQLEEMVRSREAQAQATILEIVGDLPDADMAPPENVLFICKLNPVTSDDDLEIIFSRFGKVKSCEVIRDKVTGDSLQYAFVEFEEQKSCEDAFFKMDNVLIDDRRIHVDFSQSVSKLRWKGKGRGVEHIGDNKSDNSQQNNLQGKSREKQNRSDDRYPKNDRNLQKNGQDGNRYTNTKDMESRASDRRDEHHDRKHSKNYERSNDRNFERINDRNFERSNDRNYEHNNRNYERSNVRNYERSNDRNYDRSNDLNRDRGNDRNLDMSIDRSRHYNDRNEQVERARQAESNSRREHGDSERGKRARSRDNEDVKKRTKRDDHVKLRKEMYIENNSKESSSHRKKEDPQRRMHNDSKTTQVRSGKTASKLKRSSSSSSSSSSDSDSDSSSVATKKKHKLTKKKKEDRKMLKKKKKSKRKVSESETSSSSQSSEIESKRLIVNTKNKKRR